MSFVASLRVVRCVACGSRGEFIEQPWIFWNTDNIPALTLEGKIGGEPVMVMFLSDPFRDGEDDFQIYQGTSK